jgi:hypothetical protein
VLGITNFESWKVESVVNLVSVVEVNTAQAIYLREVGDDEYWCFEIYFLNVLSLKQAKRFTSWVLLPYTAAGEISWLIKWNMGSATNVMV